MNKRYFTIDYLRGICLINMIIYHGLWDLVYIFNFDFSWFDSVYCYIWQQFICWSFIFISGFCYNFSKNKFKRGLIIFLAGLLITAVTQIIIPEDHIIFGILTLIGSCMIVLLPLNKIMNKCNPILGFVLSFILFFITRNVNVGYLGFEGLRIIKLPAYLYKNLFTTYLGFCMNGFYSADYFSIIPWIFLFVAGFYFMKILKNNNKLYLLEPHRNTYIEFLGKKSLIIYLLHQPILYLVLLILWVS